jgi:hypothetical protein
MKNLVLGKTLPDDTLISDPPSRDARFFAEAQNDKNWHASTKSVCFVILQPSRKDEESGVPASRFPRDDTLISAAQSRNISFFTKAKEPGIAAAAGRTRGFYWQR